jgi:hypothetical protein
LSTLATIKPPEGPGILNGKKQKERWGEEKEGCVKMGWDTEEDNENPDF